MVCGESSDDVDSSGASSKNGSTKLTIDRHTIGVTGGLTILYTCTCHPHTNFVRLETLYGMHGSLIALIENDATM